jgi:hypothetical protein
VNTKGAVLGALLASIALLALSGCGGYPRPRPQTPSYALPALAPRPSFDQNAQPSQPADEAHRFTNDSLAGAIGARVGFSQTQDRGDFAAAGVFGLEIFKTSALMVDLQARALALVGNPDGPHAGVQPSLGFDLDF